MWRHAWCLQNMYEKWGSRNTYVSFILTSALYLILRGWFDQPTVQYTSPGLSTAVFYWSISSTGELHWITSLLIPGLPLELRDWLNPVSYGFNSKWLIKSLRLWINVCIMQILSSSTRFSSCEPHKGFGKISVPPVIVMLHSAPLFKQVRRSTLEMCNAFLQCKFNHNIITLRIGLWLLIQDASFYWKQNKSRK